MPSLLAPAAWIGVLAGGFPGVAVGTAVANPVAGLMALAIIAKHDLRTRRGGRSADCDLSECE